MKRKKDSDDDLHLYLDPVTDRSALMPDYSAALTADNPTEYPPLLHSLEDFEAEVKLLLKSATLTPELRARRDKLCPNTFARFGDIQTPDDMLAMLDALPVEFPIGSTDDAASVVVDWRLLHSRLLGQRDLTTRMMMDEGISETQARLFCGFALIASLDAMMRKIIPRFNATLQLVLADAWNEGVNTLNVLVGAKKNDSEVLDAVDGPAN